MASNSRRLKNMSEEDEKQTKLSEHIVKSIIQPISEKPSFTTEAKSGRRKPNKTSVSLEKAKVFMEHLWSKGLKECSYGTLEYEFILCFGTNEPRVLERYLGRLKSVENHPGSTVVRLNRQSGNIAKFDYMNSRRIQPKKGLLEILGFVTQEEGGRFILHHELFPYCSKQSSIDNLCVRSIEAGESKQQHSREVSSEDKKEEEVIDNTHTKDLRKKYTLRV
jgi:hypothetical protein